MPAKASKVRALQALVPDINALERRDARRSPTTRLQAKTAEFRQRLDNGETLDDLLIEAFAVTREAADRVIGQRHYDVQLMGGAALHFGWVAEMKTGEGKTLVVDPAGRTSTPSPARASTSSRSTTTWPRRDAEWMGQIHRWLGPRPSAWSSPATYDWRPQAGPVRLRHHLRHQQRVRLRLPARQHGDEPGARRSSGATTTPSSTRSTRSSSTRPAPRSSSRAGSPTRPSSTTSSPASSGASTRDVDYDVDEEKRTVAPTDEGVEAVEQALGVENMYDEVSTRTSCTSSRPRCKAKELFKRDKDYVVQHGEVKIVDEFTGRILEGRRWSEGLHQAVEAKEGVKIKEENQTLATITLQNYFRLYDKLAGMTGTAETEAAEFAQHLRPRRSCRSRRTAR